MKLIKLKIKNFKCLKDFEIPIQKFNLLIGENDSGKSSVLDALNLILNDELPSNDDFFRDQKGRIANEIEIICLFNLSDNEKDILREYSFNYSELKYKKVISKNSVKKYVYSKKYVYEALNLRKTELNKKNAGDLDKIITDLKITFKKGERINKDARIKKIIEFRSKAEFIYNWIEIKKEIKNYLPKFIRYDTNDYESPEQMVYKTLQAVYDSFIYNINEETGEKSLIQDLKTITKDVKQVFNEEIKKLLPYIKKYNETITDVAIRPEIDFSRGLKTSPIELKDKYGIFPLESKGQGTKKRLFLSFLEWDREIIKEAKNYSVIRGYDEPDTSLHYEAQRRLFYNILDIINQSQSNIQALLCTHSLTMINRADSRNIYYLTLNNKGITEINYLKSFEDEEIESYLTELSIGMGLPNSSLFFERCFLIIEGETEEHCLPKLYMRKYNKRFIEDGICLVNVNGIGNAKGFIKLLRKNKENCLIFLFDGDCNNPDSTCRLTKSELEDMGFDSNFIEERAIYIGDKEFEDSFKNNTIVKVLNTYWEKVDGSPWNNADIEKIRKEDKFSKRIMIEANKLSRKKKIDWFTKPRFGEKLGELCKLEDFPKEITKLFEKARMISKVE